MPPTDPNLVDAVARGDQAALGKLLEFYQGPIYNTCLRMLGNRDDAAEVTQEAMLKIIEHVHDFHGHSDISTWMIRIAMNLAISHLRKRKLRQAASLDGSMQADDQTTALRRELADHREPPPDSRVENNEMILNLQQALARLDDDFRAIVVLRDIQEMDYQQIADVLSLPVGTVKSRLFRARLALRHELLRLTGAAATGAGQPAAANTDAQHRLQARPNP